MWQKISWLITTPITVLLVLLAVNNRETVTLSFWPLSAQVQMPLWLLFLFTLTLGALLGLVWMWFQQRPHRAEAKRLRKENSSLSAEIARQADELTALKNAALMHSQQNQLQGKATPNTAEEVTMPNLLGQLNDWYAAFIITYEESKMILHGSASLPPYIKISGLKTAACVEAAVAGAAHMLGFMLTQHPTQFIAPRDAEYIIANIPAEIKIVGMFGSAEDDIIEEALSHCPLDILQFVAPVSVSAALHQKQRTGLPVFYHFALTTADDIKTIPALQRQFDGLIISAKQAGAVTAIGVQHDFPFPWEWLQPATAARTSARLQAQSGTPIFIAGGIDAANGAQALQQSGAQGIDIHSSLCVRAGVLCPQKITNFLAQMHQIMPLMATDRFLS